MSNLGRRVPTDWQHTEKYPLTAGTMPTKPTPATIGINWYTDFDKPVLKRNGRKSEYWIGLDVAKLGTVRGGHCICVKPAALSDSASWWGFYNQGDEGACVGFGSSRMMTLLNRVRYDANWLYNQAQLADEFPDTPPAEGTTVRAGMDVLRKLGHVREIGGKDKPVNLADGISANRWATSMADVYGCLQSPDYEKRGAVPLLNSWGTDYPHVVWMPEATFERVVFTEQGECTVVTDR